MKKAIFFVVLGIGAAAFAANSIATDVNVSFDAPSLASESVENDTPNPHYETFFGEDADFSFASFDFSETEDAHRSPIDGGK